MDTASRTTYAVIVTERFRHGSLANDALEQLTIATMRRVYGTDDVTELGIVIVLVEAETQKQIYLRPSVIAMPATTLDEMTASLGTSIAMPDISDTSSPGNHLVIAIGSQEYALEFVDLITKISGEGSEDWSRAFAEAIRRSRGERLVFDDLANAGFRSVQTARLLQ